MCFVGGLFVCFFVFVLFCFVLFCFFGGEGEGDRKQDRVRIRDTYRNVRDGCIRMLKFSLPRLKRKKST